MELREWIESNYSASSVKNYLQLIDRYRNFVNAPEQGNYQDVIDYLAHLRRRLSRFLCLSTRDPSIS